jgi:hypothetical protein
MDIAFILLPEIFLKNLKNNSIIGFLFQDITYCKYVNMIIENISSYQYIDIDNIIKKHNLINITEEYSYEWLKCLENSLYECNINEKNIIKIMNKSNYICAKLVIYSSLQKDISHIINKYEKNQDIHNELIDLLNNFKLK